MVLVYDTPELATPPLSSVTEQQQDQHDDDSKQKANDPVDMVGTLLQNTWEQDGRPAPANAEEFEAEPLPGGLAARLIIRLPDGKSYSFGGIGVRGEKFSSGKQARRALYRRALSLWNTASTNPANVPALPIPGPSNALDLPHGSPSGDTPAAQPAPTTQPGASVNTVPVTRSWNRRPRLGAGIIERSKAHSRLVAAQSAEVETATPTPEEPECNSNNSVLGKRPIQSEDEEEDPVADARPRKMHGRSYRAILAAYCYESGLAQPEVRHQMQVGEAGLSGQALYHISMIVDEERFALPKALDCIATAEEWLSKNVLSSFGISPQRI